VVCFQCATQLILVTIGFDVAQDTVTYHISSPSIVPFKLLSFVLLSLSHCFLSLVSCLLLHCSYHCSLFHCSFPLFLVSCSLSLVPCPLVIVLLSHCPLSHCPLFHCPLSHCPLSHCPLSHCPLSHCPLSHCPSYIVYIYIYT